MSLHPALHKITQNIILRSTVSRKRYLENIKRAGENGPCRAHLSCSGQAHAFAANVEDQGQQAACNAPNLGIITAYNDMLSAHKPYETYPELIRKTARKNGATAQVAGGVPAMCDGITQGENGMELSLFSRDVIALSAGIALSHNTFDAAVFLGVCDKIVPGLVMAAASFGHIPAVFLPAGPMTSGLENDEKARIRKLFATGEISRKELMAAEMAAYHGPGTCTFYGTANSNQMLMEFMGLHLPGSSFVNPNTPLREALTIAGTQRALQITALGNEYTPAGHILSEKTFVNGIVGLMATGGSTNLVLHLPAMARAAGIILEPQDFADISSITPLLARVYPNGLADVNHFHAAGGLGYMIGELLDVGLMHPDTKTITGKGMAHYSSEPKLEGNNIRWVDGPENSHNEKILRPVSNPFQSSGGLAQLRGNIGAGVMKVSAVAPEHQTVTAPARIFHDQDAVKTAFKAGEFTSDTVVVVRFQGPRARGMPELHSLTPILSVLQDRGLKVALVTDGRMSGASGKVPSAIHVSPEAASGGALAKLRDADMVTVDAINGKLDVLEKDFENRTPVEIDLETDQTGMGRELFQVFRQNVGSGDTGASVVV